MTAPATLPRPAQPSSCAAAAAPRAASGQARHAGLGPNSAFAQLLRGQADAPAAADAGTPSARPAKAGDADTSPARPAEPERERATERTTERATERTTEREAERERTPAAAVDASTTAPVPQPNPLLDSAPAAAPADPSGALALLGLAAAGQGHVDTTVATAQAVPAEGDSAAASDPLAALRDAAGRSLSSHRRHGPAAERGSEPASARTAAPADPAAGFGRALGEASADPAAVAARPAAPAEPAAPARDAALPSLGAVTDPAWPARAPASAAAEPGPPTAHASLPASPGTPAFGPALGLQLSTWLKDGVQHASLALHPQDLGPIDIRISVKDGQTRIDLAADVASTRQALGEALPQLSAALGDVGLNLSGGSVADPSAQGQREPGGQAQAGSGAHRSGLRGAGAGEDSHAPGPPPATARQHRGLLDLYA